MAHFGANQPSFLWCWDGWVMALVAVKAERGETTGWVGWTPTWTGFSHDGWHLYILIFGVSVILRVILYSRYLDISPYLISSIRYGLVCGKASRICWWVTEHHLKMKGLKAVNYYLNGAKSQRIFFGRVLIQTQLSLKQASKLSYSLTRHWFTDTPMDKPYSRPTMVISCWKVYKFVISRVPWRGRGLFNSYKIGITELAPISFCSILWLNMDFSPYCMLSVPCGYVLISLSWLTTWHLCCNTHCCMISFQYKIRRNIARRKASIAACLPLSAEGTLVIFLAG